MENGNSLNPNAVAMICQLHVYMDQQTTNSALPSQERNGRTDLKRQCLVLTVEAAVVLTEEANIFRSAVWHFGQLWLATSLLSPDFQITTCIFFLPFRLYLKMKCVLNETVFYVCRCVPHCVLLVLLRLICLFWVVYLGNTEQNPLKRACYRTISFWYLQTIVPLVCCDTPRPLLTCLPDSPYF